MPDTKTDTDTDTDADADADADRTDILQRSEKHIYAVAQTHLPEFCGSVDLIGGSE